MSQALFLRRLQKNPASKLPQDFNFFSSNLFHEVTWNPDKCTEGGLQLKRINLCNIIQNDSYLCVSLPLTFSQQMQ